MATHSSILAWRIPRTEEPAGYSPWGCKSQTWPRVMVTECDTWHVDRHYQRYQAGCLKCRIWGFISDLTEWESMGKGSKIVFFLILFLFFFINFSFRLHWVFIAGHDLSLVAASGGYSLLQCMGFSLQWLLLLWNTGSWVPRLQQLQPQA